MLSEHAFKMLLSSFYSNMSAQARELVELMRSSSVSGIRATPQCSRGLWEMILIDGVLE